MQKNELADPFILTGIENVTSTSQHYNTPRLIEIRHITKRYSLSTIPKLPIHSSTDQ